MTESMGNEELTARAADLAERIVDEVSRPDQDWPGIAAWADELAALARGAEKPAGAEEPPPSGDEAPSS